MGRLLRTLGMRRGVQRGKLVVISSILLSALAVSGGAVALGAVGDLLEVEDDDLLATKYLSDEQLADSVLRVLRVTIRSEPGSSDDLDSALLFSETLTQFDENGSPRIARTRIRNRDGQVVESRELTSDEVRIRSERPVGTGADGEDIHELSLDSDEEALAGAYLSAISPDSLVSAGYRPTDLPELLAPGSPHPEIEADPRHVFEPSGELDAFRLSMTSDEGNLHLARTVIIDSESHLVVAEYGLLTDESEQVLQDARRQIVRVETYDLSDLGDLTGEQE